MTTQAVVIPRTTERFDRVLNLGGASFCRYATRTAYHRLRLFLTNTMLVYILQGTKILHRPEGDRRLGPGEGFLAFKGEQLFSEIVTDEAPFVSLLFYFEDALLQEFLKDWDQPPANLALIPNTVNPGPQAVYRAGPALARLFETALPYFETPGTPKPLLRAKLSELLWTLGRQSDGAAALSALTAPGRLGPPVLQVLHEHWATNLQVGDLARLAGRSLAAFTRDVRALTGLPPRQYILEQRLRRAEAALLRPGARVTEVALDCGFGSVSHFIRLFRRRFGRSPGRHAKPA